MKSILFKGKTKDGLPYLIRYPKRTDLHEIWRYINELSKERTFINYQGEEISLEQERVWVNQMVRKNREKTSLLLIAESGGKVISVSGVDMKARAQRHLGYFGISVAKDFRNQGVGKKIMEVVIKEAVKNLDGLKIIYLDVFGNNPVARSLYKSFGFKEYGILPGGAIHRDNYVDDVLMYYDVKS